MKTKIIKNIQPAVNAIKNGEIIAFPTETVYGLGADIYNEEALRKLYNIKNRPIDKAITIMLADISQIDDLVVEVNEKAKILFEKFSPGPITIILKKARNVSDIITQNLQTVGIRIPDNNLARELIKETGPLAVPSANISGMKSPTNAKEVLNYFDGKIPYIIDGKVKLKKESTVVDLSENEIKILREAYISKEEIERALIE